MDIQKLIDFIPAMLLLISIMTIIIIVISKFGHEFFNNGYKTNNALIFVALFLFILVLITHLFKEQPWTADTLKIIIGVLIGTGSNKLTKTQRDGDRTKLTVSDIHGGNNIINQTLGNIEQKIEKFQSEISEIRHATINQYSTIEKLIDSTNNPLIKKSERLILETENESFLNQLKNLQSKYNNWTWKWIEECIKYSEFHEKINNKLEEFQNEGWKVVSIKFDNESRGIHISFELEKAYNLT